VFNYNISIFVGSGVVNYLENNYINPTLCFLNNLSEKVTYIGEKCSYAYTNKLYVVNNSISICHLNSSNFADILVAKFNSKTLASYSVVYEGNVTFNYYFEIFSNKLKSV